MSQKLKVKKPAIRRIWSRKPVEKIHASLKYERAKIKKETRIVLRNHTRQ
ncbi:MAG: hypothetical protein ABH873_01525 [Candidatus Firestonebacteria bacterium]